MANATQQVPAAPTVQPAAQPLRNLTAILGGRDYDALNETEAAEYRAAFDAFRAAHAAQHPNGQEITLAIENLSMSPDKDGIYRIQVKPSGNTFTPIFKFRNGNLEVMLVNALNLKPRIVLPTILRCSDKGVLKMKVRLVDENDTYEATDGTEGNFKRPQVQILGNIEYVPSNDVKAKCDKVYEMYAKLAIEEELRAASQPKATVGAGTPGVVNDIDDDGEVF